MPGVNVQAGPREHSLLTHVHADTGLGAWGGAGGHPRSGFSPEAMAPEPQGVAGQSGGSWGCSVASSSCRQLSALAGCPVPLGFYLSELGGDGIGGEWRADGP